jgi:UDP-N-acetylglucosamine--N-acetylmuramyl-(pentapeptide) pyrophosphoryl-undecaprenol N-acetylglucosamine transferase
VYPALAVAEAMLRRSPGVSLTFVGTVGGFERPLVEQSGLPFAAYDEVWGWPVVGVNPLRAAASVVALIVGAAQAIWLMARRRPQALLLTGGFAGLPVALASWLLRVPALIYLPDIEPGSTIRLLQRFVRRVAITAPDSAAYFPANKTVVTGYRCARRSSTPPDSRTRQRAMAHSG